MRDARKPRALMALEVFAARYNATAVPIPARAQMTSIRPAHITFVVLPAPSTNSPGWLVILSLRPRVGIDAPNVTRKRTTPMNAALRIGSMRGRLGVGVVIGVVSSVVRAANVSMVVMAHLLGAVDMQDDAPGR